MRRLFIAGWCVRLMFILMTGLVWSPAVASETDVWMDSLTRRIPERSSHTLTGSQFVELVSQEEGVQREQVIKEQLLSGNIPKFLRKLRPVTLQHRNRCGQLVNAVIFVMSDYLAIGSEDDFIRIPMDFYTASTVANKFGFILPTRKMVDAIYKQSQNHLTPLPLPPGPQMRSTCYYQDHNKKIMQQRCALGIGLGELLSGHKKDVVITNRLKQKPGRIAIYGWHRSDGNPIQPLSTVHGAGYADYSHGIRLVSDKALVDGELRSVYDILKDPEMASLLSDEGPIRGVNYSPQRTVQWASLQISPGRYRKIMRN